MIIRSFVVFVFVCAPHAVAANDTNAAMAADFINLCYERSIDPPPDTKTLERFGYADAAIAVGPDPRGGLNFIRVMRGGGVFWLRYSVERRESGNLAKCSVEAKSADASSVRDNLTMHQDFPLEAATTEAHYRLDRFIWDFLQESPPTMVFLEDFQSDQGKQVRLLRLSGN